LSGYIDINILLDFKPFYNIYLKYSHVLLTDEIIYDRIGS